MAASEQQVVDHTIMIPGEACLVPNEVQTLSFVLQFQCTGQTYIYNG